VEAKDGTTTDNGLKWGGGLGVGIDVRGDG